ncbi:DLW-39 family protein [Dermabacteraceae bacterium P13115]|nr:DLW-39 family protein [Dermabacteraceae bacterium TAE3-ERU27]MBV7432365.1 DLW-39 family protein [Dermabacteraceae bacterium TAE3-ERU5]
MKRIAKIFGILTLVVGGVAAWRQAEKKNLESDLWAEAENLPFNN